MHLGETAPPTASRATLHTNVEEVQSTEVLFSCFFLPDEMQTLTVVQA